MAGPQAGERSVRTIHLSEERIAELLKRLDEESGDVAADRRKPRYRYRMKGLLVHMQQPGSSLSIPYLVPTRNISAEGLSFLHGGFVHVGTRCVAQLITSYGTWDNVPATVVRCRYVEGNIHEVAIRFDRLIDPSIYCPDAVHTRVLVADDDPCMSKLAALHLQQLNAVVDTASNGKEAVEKAVKERYDLILMDMDMPVMDGFTAAAELRKRGYTGTIVAATAMTQPEDEKKCLEAGCDRYLAKPYTRDQLETLLASLRKEPIFSTLNDDPTMSEMIDTFVSGLPNRVRKIEEAVKKQDKEQLIRLARTLKGEGTGFGFEVITEAAAKLESALLSEASQAEVESCARALVSLCSQARSTKQTPATTT